MADFKRAESSKASVSVGLMGFGGMFSGFDCHGSFMTVVVRRAGRVEPVRQVAALIREHVEDVINEDDEE